MKFRGRYEYKKLVTDTAKFYDMYACMYVCM